MALRSGTDWAGIGQSLSAAGAIVAAIARGDLAIRTQTSGKMSKSVIAWSSPALLAEWGARRPTDRIS